MDNLIFPPKTYELQLFLGSYTKLFQTTNADVTKLLV